MSNLFEKLVKSAPVGNRLQFGIAENVRIMTVDTNIRKNKGLPLKQNTFIKMCQFDPETGKIKAQSEGSFWNLDHASEFIGSNFEEQITSILAIIEAINPDGEKAVNGFDNFVMDVLPDKLASNLDVFIRTKEGAEAVQKAMIDGAKKYLKPFVGEKSPLLRCKITTNKKGFFELGKEMNWVLPMNSERELPLITPYEKKVYRESLKADTDTQLQPDSVGGEKKVSKPLTF